MNTPLCCSLHQVSKFKLLIDYRENIPLLYLFWNILKEKSVFEVLINKYFQHKTFQTYLQVAAYLKKYNFFSKIGVKW